MSKEQLYTQEGYQKLIDEFDYLTKVRREEIKVAIAEARSFGDLSENAEYDEARNEQAKTEARIKELEELIRNAKVIDEDEIDTSIVSIGSTVKLRTPDGSVVEYSIVGSNEADPASYRISDLSPIGKALVDARAKAGAKVSVDTPAGTIHIEVRDVTRTRNN